MINGFVCFDRIRSADDIVQLEEKAKQDDHGVIAPSHILRKDGNVVGYFSVGTPGIPVVLAWLSTKEIPPRESFHLINCVEDMVARGGAMGVMFPVPPKSPFHPLMEEMGYKNAGSYDLFVKPL